MLSWLLRREGADREERELSRWAAGALLLLEAGDTLGANAADAIYLARLGPGGLGVQLSVSSLLLVITLGWIGAAADRRERTRVLATAALGAAALLAGLQLALALAPAVAPHALLVVSKQAGAAADLAFWIWLADRLDARQARRLVPRLLVAGGAGTLLASAITRPIVAAGGAEWLLASAAAAMALVAAMAGRLARLPVGRPLDRVAAVEAPAAAPGLLTALREGGRAAWRSSLARWLAVIVAVAGALGPVFYAAVGHAAAEARGDEAALAGFFAELRAISQFAVLAAQALIAPLAARLLGAGQAMLVAPLLSLGLALPLALRGGLPAAAVAMVGARVLDAAVETPAERLAQNLLPRGVRGRVAAFLDGTAKRLGAVAGGALVMASAAWLGWTAVAVAGAWTVAAMLLARRYGSLAVAELGQGMGAGEQRPAELALDEATRRALARDLAGADDALRERAIALCHAASPAFAAAALVRAAAATDGAARERLLAALDRHLPALPQPPSQDLAGTDAALARLCALRLGGDAGTVVIRAAGLLASSSGFARLCAELEPLARDGGVPETQRITAHCVVARRSGAEAELDRVVDGVLEVSEQARQRAAEALVRGGARASAPAALAMTVLAELATEARLAQGERRARMRGWLLAAAYRDEPLASAALEALARAAEADAARGDAPAIDAAAVDLAESRAADLLASPPARAAAARLLAACADPGRVPALARLLADGDEETRALAAAGLVRLGPAGAPALLTAARFGRRAARDTALAALRDLRVPPAALDEVVESEILALQRARAHAHALAGLSGPAAELLRQRLDERGLEISRTLLLVLEARTGDPRIGRAAERWFAADDRRARARALEAIDALSPRGLSLRLCAALEEVSEAERLSRAARDLGGLPGEAEAVRAELGGADAIAGALLVHALGAGGRAAHRETIRAAALATPRPSGEMGAVRLLRRIADSDEEDLEMPGNVETMSVLRQLPLFSALSVRQLAEVAAQVEWRAVAAGGSVLDESDADALYMVGAGRVRVVWGDAGEQVMAAGGAFGERALLGAGAPPRAAEALERASVGRLGRAAFERLVDDSPRIALALCRALLVRAGNPSGLRKV